MIAGELFFRIDPAVSFRTKSDFETSFFVHRLALDSPLTWMPSAFSATMNLARDSPMAGRPALPVLGSA
jgi:hypothetical protein